MPQQITSQNTLGPNWNVVYLLFLFLERQAAERGKDCLRRRRIDTYDVQIGNKYR
jgi:hypothetical protein